MDTKAELVKLLSNSGTNEEAKLVLEFFIALVACNANVPLVLDTRDQMQKVEDQGPYYICEWIEL
jgi:phospholipid-transporting ATPase